MRDLVQIEPAATSENPDARQVRFFLWPLDFCYRTGQRSKSFWVNQSRFFVLNYHHLCFYPYRPKELQKMVAFTSNFVALRAFAHLYLGTLQEIPYALHTSSKPQNPPATITDPNPKEPRARHLRLASQEQSAELHFSVMRLWSERQCQAASSDLIEYCPCRVVILRSQTK